MSEIGRLFLKLTGACLIVAAIFYGGWLMGKATAQTGRDMACFAYSTYAGSYAEYMYRDGNYRSAREALLQAASIYKDLRDKEKDITFRDIYTREMVVIYGRLAAIEKKKKNAGEMDKHIAEAVKLCPQQTYFRDACSSGDALLKLIRGLDKKYQ